MLYAALVGIKARVLLKGLLSPRRPFDIARDSDFGNLEQDDASTSYSDTAADIQELKAIVRENGFERIVLRGSGHSQNGSTLAMAPGGVKLGLLDGNQDPAGFEIEEHANGISVTTSARIRWIELENFLNARGLAAPVLTDVLETSIGGTLSVGGGYGARSIRHGAQFSGLERIRFVNPEGEEQRIEVVPGGAVERRLIGRLGRDGILLDVTMKVIPYRCLLIRYSCLYRSLAEQLAHLGRLLDDPEFTGLVDRCTLRFRPFDARLCQSTFGFESDSASAFDVSRRTIEKALAPHVYKRRSLNTREHVLEQMDRAHQLVRAMPPYRVWCDFAFADLGACEAFLNDAYRNYRFDATFGLPVRADVAQTQVFGSTPLFREQESGRPYSLGVGLYRFFSDRASATRAREEVGELFQLARSLGGRPYLYGGFPRWVIDDHLERTRPTAIRSSERAVGPEHTRPSSSQAP